MGGSDCAQRDFSWQAWRSAHLVRNDPGPQVPALLSALFGQQRAYGTPKTDDNEHHAACHPHDRSCVLLVKHG